MNDPIEKWLEEVEKTHKYCDNYYTQLLPCLALVRIYREANYTNRKMTDDPGVKAVTIFAEHKALEVIK